MLPRNEELWHNNITLVDLIYYTDIIKLDKFILLIKTISSQRKYDLNKLQKFWFPEDLVVTFSEHPFLSFTNVPKKLTDGI